MKTYLAKFNPKENKGVYAISLVNEPAMEGLFIALSKQEEIKFAEVDKEQRILMGLVLEPNKKIYRNQGGEEFNIVFNEETIKDLSHNFFKAGNQNNSTIEHKPENIIEGVTFVESWIIENSEIDKSANFGFSYPKGSWMATMKVDSDDIWNDYVKTGKVQGFSVDAFVSLEEVKLAKNYTSDGTPIWFEKTILNKGDVVTDLEGVALKDGVYQLMNEVAISVENGLVVEMKEINLKPIINMSKTEEKSFIQLLKDLPSQIALALKKDTDVKLGSKKLADGSLTLEYEGEQLTAGAPVWITADDGTKVPAPVGEHALEGDMILVITEEGIVGEVKEATEPVDMNAPVGNSNDAQIAEEISTAIKSILIKYSEQEKRIAKVENENVELAKQVLELGQQPASKGIKQPEVAVDFSKLTKKERLNTIINQVKK